MKIAIVYKSLTGNTAMVAEALKEALKEKGPVYFGPPEGCPEAELYFVGSWTDKGSCAGRLVNSSAPLKINKLPFSVRRASAARRNISGFFPPGRRKIWARAARF